MLKVLPQGWKLPCVTKRWRGCQSDMLDIGKAAASSSHSLAGGLKTMIGGGHRAIASGLSTVLRGNPKALRGSYGTET